MWPAAGSWEATTIPESRIGATNLATTSPFLRSIRREPELISEVIRLTLDATWFMESLDLQPWTRVGTMNPARGRHERDSVMDCGSPLPLSGAVGPAM